MLNSKHFIGIHGYMLVYSVGSQQSFDMVSVIRDKILNHLVSRCKWNALMARLTGSRGLTLYQLW